MDLEQELAVVRIDRVPLKTVQKFKYLGSHVTADNKIDAEITYRIQSAASSFGKLERRLWSNHNITLKTKLKVFKVVVLTALLYSVETMTLYRKHIYKLTSFQTRHLRRLMNIKWQDKISNIDVLKRANMPSVEAMITTAQLRWTGHVVRMSDKRLPKILLYGELLEGTRAKGGQKLRYKDVLKSHLKRTNCEVSNWENIAKDRKSWKDLVKKSTSIVEQVREEEYRDLRES